MLWKKEEVTTSSQGARRRPKGGSKIDRVIRTFSDPKGRSAFNTSSQRTMVETGTEETVVVMVVSLCATLAKPVRCGTLRSEKWLAVLTNARTIPWLILEARTTAQVIKACWRSFCFLLDFRIFALEVFLPRGYVSPVVVGVIREAF